MNDFYARNMSDLPSFFSLVLDPSCPLLRIQSLHHCRCPHRKTMKMLHTQMLLPRRRLHIRNLIHCPPHHLETTWGV